ncbi:MAG: glutamate synthase subunit alpha, partial [Verrucomicrobia bacterium]|nr:glutamate synthase subunit alpha [Verrucomicrobiota bacterium]
MTIRAQNKSDRIRAQQTGPPAKQGLYDPQFEHEACGVGFVVNIKGRKSHAIIQQALQVLMNLNHRGACGCESNTGDCAGILIQPPHEFLKLVAREARVTLPAAGEYGVGMVFLPQDTARRAECEKIFATIAAEEGQPVLGWRTVPTSNVTLGATALAAEPLMRQVYLARNLKLTDEAAFERKLYVIRKRAENTIRYSGKVAGGEFFYVSSLSYKTIVYKGMLLTEQLSQYYPDLSHPAMESALALVHSRFRTNTFPSWNRAHPYRYIAHNGEINTLRGNINWMHARQAMFDSDLFGDDLKKVWPLHYPGQSDSASFDNSLELLVMGG